MEQVVIARTYNQETSLQSQELQASRQQSQELQSIVTIAEIVIAIQVAIAGILLDRLDIELIAAERISTVKFVTVRSCKSMRGEGEKVRNVVG